MEERLKVNNFSHDVENVQFENAGHLISRNLDYISKGREGQMYIGGKAYKFEYGGTIEGDKAAIVQSWEKIKAFCRNLMLNKR
ncbi:MAG: acyl-CoA thioester hydrolase/BAAT C-terminal domain-containing protein, partial [Bacteroidota bacterium]